MSAPSGGSRVQFGGFEVLPASGELRKNGVALKLQPQPFRVLALLVSRSGELVTREDIRRELWGSDTTVEFDQGLNFCIRQIRTVLGDDARDPKFIETVPKRGYRFIATLTDDTDQHANFEASQTQKATQAAPPREITGNEFSASETPHPTTSTVHHFTVLSQAVVLTILVLLAGCGVWMFAFGNTSNSGPQSILVRPFVSIGLSEQDQWFADALTQQLILELARGKTVRVTPWTTALALKDQPITTKQIRERFGVDAVLEGSVTRMGDRLEIDTHLVDANADRTIWSHVDQRDKLDLGGLQEDVTNSLASLLKLRLSEAERATASRRPADPEVYNLYLRAVYLADQFNTESTSQSIELFNDVIHQAPSFAPAYAGLALAESIQPPRLTSRVKDLLDAQTAAHKALELNPNLAEGHTALAHALFKAWQWKAAEREFQNALQLEPESATTHQLYGIYLGTVGRLDEAIREEQHALALAPSSPLVTYSLATVLLHAGRFEESVLYGKRTQQLSPHYALSYLLLTRAYTALGQIDEAMAILDEWKKYGNENVQPLWLASTLAKAGERDRARQTVKSWLDTNFRAKNPPLALAAAFTAIGDRRAALEAIHSAVDNRVSSISWLKVTPELSVLRADPDFKSALANMELN